MQLPASNHIIGPCLYVEVDLMHPWPHLQKSVTANAVGLCFMLMHTYICQQSHVSDPYQASGLSSVLPQEAPVVSPNGIHSSSLTLQTLRTGVACHFIFSKNTSHALVHADSPYTNFVSCR